MEQNLNIYINSDTYIYACICVYMYIYICVCVCVCVCESESVSHPVCLVLCDPMDCSPPGSYVHGILQSGILDWVAMPSSRRSF